MVLVKCVQHSGRYWALAQGLGADVVDFLHRRFNVDAQNIDFIGIPQNLAEHPRAVVQLFRQAEGTVPRHRRAQQGVLGGILYIVADVPLVKQHACTQCSVADGLGIDEGVVPPQLLKAADIVQHAGKPGQVRILRRQGQAFGNTVTQRGHAVGVVDFQLDLRVGGVVVRSVVGKGALCAGTVDFHMNHFLAPIVAYLHGGANRIIYKNSSTADNIFVQNP